MKIAKFENLHWRRGVGARFPSWKVTTDDGLIGWSEYTEADGSPRPVRRHHGYGRGVGRD